MIDVVQICKNVLTRLSAMDFEKGGGNSTDQLIFPMKIQKKGTKQKDRVSEQELRLLFIEEFKKIYPKLFYSVETPTVDKFSLGKFYETIKSDIDGQSALLDMCIYERKSNVYYRILNIEFKHKNRSVKRSGKDVLKLLQEKQDGAFIHLLDNTDRGTLCNIKETGVLNKLYKSFSDFQGNWNNADKSIQLIILSLKQKTLIHRTLNKTDLSNLKDIFYVTSSYGNIKEIIGNGWQSETITYLKI
jgi:hypothetical protein